MSTENAPESVLPARLRQAMAARRFSIRRLASVTTIPYRTLQNYLLGVHAIPAEALLKICAAMEVSADWLYRDRLFVDVEDMKEALHRSGTVPRDGTPANATAAVTLVGALNLLNDIQMSPLTFRSLEAIDAQTHGIPSKRTARKTRSQGVRKR
jgi:transcriptional regulator with XRE-family HTH domain